MNDITDPDIAVLLEREEDVLRAQAKMRKSVSFRDLRQGGARHSFAAWYTPTHHITEPCAPYFAQRLPDLDWMIATPDVTAQFIDGNLTFHPGQPKPDWPRGNAQIAHYLGDLFNPTGEIPDPRI
jgi:DNA polymerase